MEWLSSIVRLAATVKIWSKGGAISAVIYWSALLIFDFGTANATAHYPNWNLCVCQQLMSLEIMPFHAADQGIKLHAITLLNLPLETEIVKWMRVFFICFLFFIWFTVCATSNAVQLRLLKWKEASKWAMDKTEWQIENTYCTLKWKISPSHTTKRKKPFKWAHKRMQLPLKTENNFVQRTNVQIT